MPITRIIKFFKDKMFGESKQEEPSGLKARDIMSSGSKLFVLFAHYTREEIINTFLKSNQTVLLVCGNSIDDVKGSYSFKTLLRQSTNNEYIDISQVQPVKMIAHNTDFIHILSLLYKNNEPLLVITNEFGGTEGVITKNSIADSIYDNTENITKNYFNNSNKHTLILDGQTKITHLKSLFNIDPDYDCDTLGGFVLASFNSMPYEGDSFYYEDYLFTVLEIKNNAISKIQLQVKQKNNNLLN